MKIDLVNISYAQACATIGTEAEQGTKELAGFSRHQITPR